MCLFDTNLLSLHEKRYFWQTSDPSLVSNLLLRDSSLEWTVLIFKFLHFNFTSSLLNTNVVLNKGFTDRLTKINLLEPYIECFENP